DGNRIDRHADAAAQQERADDEQELVGLVLRQLVQVHDLDDVGATVPDEVDVQRQALVAAEGFLRIRWVDREIPLDGGRVGSDRDDLQVVQERKTVRPHAGLGLQIL